MGQESAGDIVYKETFYGAVSVSDMVAIVPVKDKEIHDLKKTNEQTAENLVKVNAEYKDIKAKVNKEKKDEEKKAKKSRRKSS